MGVFCYLVRFRVIYIHNLKRPQHNNTLYVHQFYKFIIIILVQVWWGRNCNVIKMKFKSHQSYNISKHIFTQHLHIARKQTKLNYPLIVFTNAISNRPYKLKKPCQLFVHIIFCPKQFQIFLTFNYRSGFNAAAKFIRFERFLMMSDFHLLRLYRKYAS